MATTHNKTQYHYIYKTTCKITGKYYYGMHSTFNLNDGYMGSGVRLGYSIGKYGKDNHTTNILEYCNNRHDLAKRESEIINDALLKDPMCMNLKLGGFGTYEHIRARPEYNAWTKQGRKKTDEILSTKGLTKKDLGKLGAAACKLNNKGAAFDPMIKAKYNFKVNKTNQQLGNSPSARAKAAVSISKTHAKNGHGAGMKNSQYDTCWIYSLELKKSIKIANTQVTNYLANGWHKGRKMKFND